MEIPSMSLAEASKSLFGRTHRFNTWAAVIGYSIEPPEQFSREDIRQTVYPEGRVNSRTNDIGVEIELLISLGMVEQISEQQHGKVKAPAYFKRVESPGWEMVDAAIRAFGVWFPAEGVENT